MREEIDTVNPHQEDDRNEEIEESPVPDPESDGDAGDDPEAD
jgi:hypothetical protein